MASIKIVSLGPPTGFFKQLGLRIEKEEGDLRAERSGSKKRSKREKRKAHNATHLELSAPHTYNIHKGSIE